MYQHGKKARRPRSTTAFIAVVFLAGLFTVIGLYIIRQDAGSDTDQKTTVPILTEVSASNGDVQQVSEPEFSMELPEDWQIEERRKDENIHFYKWKSTKKGSDARNITVYIDSFTFVPKVVKLQPISVGGSKLILGTMSEDCINFVERKDSKDTAPIPAKWENVAFLCDPISANQSVGTGSSTDGYSVPIGDHRYFFFYQDFNSRPDNKIFTDILSSFVAK